MREDADESSASRGLSSAPDTAEQDARLDDDAIPTRGYSQIPMVGLGGSAGSVPALRGFFRALPLDTGFAFVVILHLSPTHESSFADVIGHMTSMPVHQATDGMGVEPNHVYVIPSGKFLTAANGRLRLTDLEPHFGKRVAVDLFFRTLADTHGPHAAAIVLSGGDGDGTIGIKRIKERGGLTVAQDPEDAEQPSMPRSAIGTGMIDWILKPEQMPARLIEYYETARRLRLPPEEGTLPTTSNGTKPGPDEAEGQLREVLLFVQTRTGCDFSYYKRATVLRRIARRMQVNRIDGLAPYMDFLRTHPGEAGALLQDLLISVTNFFRDRDVFLALQSHLPKVFRDKNQGDVVRVWVPACATGEEAYSIAMMLLEHARTLDVVPTLQVFACDLDEEAIKVGRAGHYPEAISADVSDERLRRFFVKEHDGYRVRRELREMVLFAAHDLLKDAPFSRMDLVSCRNLLIYLNGAAQARAFGTFHFALRPGGLMLLGASETVDEGNPFFGIVDKKHRIYAQRPASRSIVHAPTSSTVRIRGLEPQALTHGAAFQQGRRLLSSSLAVSGRPGDRNSLVDLHLQLVERYAPPSVVVNAEHELLHLSEHAGVFLQLHGGEPSNNVLRLAHPALRVELRASLVRAAETNSPVVSPEVVLQLDGKPCAVRLHVRPAGDLSPGLTLVVFEKREGNVEQSLGGPTPNAATREPIAILLDRELENVRNHLRDTVEQYEASTEELKASNEELQAMNEELRSATEELETSREELQSINEELITVNHEMKGKVDELAHANSDLSNLMASTSIATVFLDRALSITRYTPDAAGIFNLIPSDVGRPLEHLRHRLHYPELIADAEGVLRTLIPVERQVRDDRRWYFGRIQPYRTIEDHIAGVVLTLVDVTESKLATEALRVSEDRMRLLIESAKDYGIFTTDEEGRINSWNLGAEALFGHTETEIVGKNFSEIFVPEDVRDGVPAREMQQARDTGRAKDERWHRRSDGSTFYGSGALMPLRDRGGELRGYVKILRDLTETKKTQEELAERMDELSRFNAAAVGREVRMIELKAEVNALSARLGEPAPYETETESKADPEEKRS